MDSRLVQPDLVADGNDRCGESPCWDAAGSERSGRLLLVHGAGEATALDEGILLANGLGFSADSSRLYFTDTFARKIYRYAVDAATGLVADRRVFVGLLEPDAFTRLASLDARGWAAFAFLALMVLGLSMILFFTVLKSLPVTVALASTYITPVFGFLLAMLLLGEGLTRVTIVGSALVLAATVLVMRHDAEPAGADGA